MNWHGGMCGKGSCYKGKYLAMGVEGFEVGCLWLADPSDSWHNWKPSVVVYWRYFLSSYPHEGSWDFLKWFSRQQGYRGYKRYIIISVVVWSITLQNFSPWIGRCSSPSPSNEVIRIPACCKKGLHFCCLDVGVSVITAHLTQSEKLTTR